MHQVSITRLRQLAHGGAPARERRRKGGGVMEEGGAKLDDRNGIGRVCASNTNKVGKGRGNEYKEDHSKERGY